MTLFDEYVILWLYFTLGLVAAILVILSFLVGEVADFVGDLTSPVAGWMGDHLPFGHPAEGAVGFTHFFNGGMALGFLGGFGFTAALAMAAFGASPLGAAGWGFGGGLVLGAFMGLIYMGLTRAAATSSYEAPELVGLMGEVTQRIFPGGVGEVRCSIKGTPVWYTARSLDGKEVPVGTVVRVVRTVGGILFVTPEAG